ncbi:hypothetical protein GE061_005537 [Apolygus lucorum]|uniref:Uncharacterized protein n=1 Tax=Apolygus lucorum TaxID=248454 RepID=A0A6A4J2A4_APOLU|nr:hypothetical protein GE061_005537 [Apolygus lucorum]
MSAGDANTTVENVNESGTGETTWYILDETGDTQLDILPRNVTAPEDLSTAFEDVKIDLSDTVDSKADLSTTFEDAKEVVSVVENNGDLSCEFEDARVLPCVLDDKEVSEKEMFRFRTLKSLHQNVTPRTSPRGGRKLKKRKRKPTTPQPPNNTTTPGQGSGKALNKKKKRKKSVILIDSDSEPDDSVIEIADDSSVIVLSDDEVGVCSGTLTKPKAKKQNTGNVLKNSNPILGEHFKKKEGTSTQDHSPEKIKKNAELYQPMADQSEKKTGLRPIVIDGCNVAFGHGRDRFSSLGLKICVDYFKKLGHEVRVFLPQFRKHHNATTDPQLLDAMEKEGTLCYTPSRRTDEKMIVSYDDRFIVQYADASGGVIVSRDNYRDLLNENPEWKETIHKRLLMYTWVGDTIMFPKDPLGRHGPNLEEFLKF